MGGCGAPAKRERTSREKILAAACTLFNEYGFHGTSLDHILAASGVCRSNFYYHFKSKEDLALDVLRRQAKRFEIACIDGILEDRRLTARGRLERLYQMVAERQRAEAYRCGCPFGNLAAELAGTHAEFRQQLNEIFGRWEQSVERCLREGVARGELRPDLEPHETASALISHIEGAILLMKACRDDRPLAAGGRTMLKLLEGR